MRAVVDKYDVSGIRQMAAGIRKGSGGKVWQNFYDWNSDKEYCGVCAGDTIVFWAEGDSVIRGWFYSANAVELAELLKLLPKGCIIDYLTQSLAAEIREVFAKAGLRQIYEMHRMSEGGITPEQRKMIETKLAKMRRLYMPERVRAANLSDLAMIYKKLYEVFDARMSHLPTKAQLEEYIKNGWVIVYHEGDAFLGLYIFLVQRGGTHYGYLIWNGGGPIGYFSLREKGKEAYREYITERGYDPKKVPAAYSWVDVNNPAALGVIEWRGGSFDGLYDFVYEKE